MAGYPLESLRSLRAGEKQAKALDLAGALALAASAASALVAAEARRDEISERLARTRGAFDRGGAASLLARADEHARALRVRMIAEEGAVARARAALTEAEAEVTRARGGVARARADEQVVERHRDRWQDEERRRRERAADE